jgi:aryl-alcohol dehydrogenase-like predicted oxidoreductase
VRASDRLVRAGVVRLAKGLLTGKYRPGGADVTSERAAARAGTSSAAARPCSTSSTPSRRPTRHPGGRRDRVAARPAADRAAPIASARTPEQLAAILPGASLELGADEVERLSEASAAAAA